jgi:hypothetical protein
MRLVWALGIMKPSPQFIVYLIGITLLGFFYEPVKAMLGGCWLFVVCAIFYLVALLLAGVAVAGILVKSRAK